MTTIIKRKYKKKVKDFLWDRFHLVHEHIGFENAESIDKIIDVARKYCEKQNIISTTDKINPLFRDKFLQEISSIVCYWLRTKYHKRIKDDGAIETRENKYFLRGFECELVNGKGYYYYPKNEIEQNRIITFDLNRLDSKKRNFEIRQLERKDYRDLLPSHDEDSKLPEHDKDKDVV